MSFVSEVADRLRAAYRGYEEFLDWYARGFVGRRLTKDEVVDSLRRIPTDDMSKKRELADFFQSEQGQHYSKDERRQAYDDLLGRERNSEAR